MTRLNQPKLLDVPVTDIQAAAERYADMEAEIRDRQEQLKTQASRVMELMQDAGTSFYYFKDQWGVRHEFEVSAPGLKLKHKKHGSPVEKVS